MFDSVMTLYIFSNIELVNMKHGDTTKVLTIGNYLVSYIVQQVKKKKRNTPIYFNTNYRREMKLVPII